MKCSHVLCSSRISFPSSLKDIVLDSITCENCGVAPGESVRLSKVSVDDAGECFVEPSSLNAASHQLSFVYAAPIILQALGNSNYNSYLILFISPFFF